MEIKSYKLSSSYIKAVEAEEQAESEHAHAKSSAKQVDVSKQGPANLASQNVMFAMDKDENVIIKFIDIKSGKVVKQVPAQEYLEMSDDLKKISGKLFHIEV
ncbi:MAG: flagellar protein FlaG [Nitrospirae bacterium]|nr:flagellar protein FlaG [Nitrospirota bacterium]